MSEVKLATRMAALNESATLALNARAKQLAAEGRTIYNLTAGELDTSTPEYIQKSVAEHLGENKYTPVAGLPELRQKIASHAKTFYDLEWIGPSNVVVTAGAKPAIYAALLAIIEPGDEVIVPVPAWVSYMDLIKLAGGKVITVPLAENHDLDADSTAALITDKTKAILLNSPHNPTGAVFSESSIANLARHLENKKITIIADDIYTKLIFTDNIPLPAKAGFKNVIIINGFSKSQAITGWRIGYLIAETKVADAATALLSHITGNAPLPSQYAALSAMARDDKPPSATVGALYKQRQLVLDRLSDIGIKHNVPGGAFYIFLDLRELTDNSKRWCEELLSNAGVALVPGEAFEAPGFARLTFAADQDYLLAALQKIQDFVKGGSK